MKTITDFKNRLQLGVKVHTIYHLAFAGRDPQTLEVIYKDEDKGEREVSKKQSNSFAFKTWKESEQKFVDSWCNYPKVKECKFIDADTVQILEEDCRVREGEKPMIPVLTYKFI